MALNSGDRKYWNSLRQAAPVQVEFGFRTETDLNEWARSYSQGQVPDAVPYGLNKMTSTGASFTMATLAPLTAGQGLALVLGGRGLPAVPGWSIAWDERIGLRMLANTTGRKTGCGIIWATDEVRRGFAAQARTLLRMHMLRSLDLVWCLSRAQVAPLRHALRRSDTRVEFLKFGVDTQFFSNRPLPLQPAVLSVGNDQDRDLPTLFAALQQVHDARPEVNLRVQFTGDLALPPGVERLPQMTHAELRDEYARASLIAIATRPNLHVSGMTAALEAMSTGRPVVLSRTPGAEDYVADGVWGALAQTGNAADMARLILLCLETGTAQRLGAAAREAAQREFDTTQMAERLAAILRS